MKVFCDVVVRGESAEELVSRRIAQAASGALFRRKYAASGLCGREPVLFGLPHLAIAIYGIPHYGK